MSRGVKIAVVIVRTLTGLLFLFASISFLFDLIPPPELTGNTKIFMDGMIASGYMMPLVKVTELVCGIAFVSGFFVPLAAVVIAPVVVNILLFHVFVDTAGLPLAVCLVFANLFIAWAYRERYRPLLSA